VNAADLLIRCLEHEGVEFMFGVPGEETLDVMDSILGSGIRFVTTRHEQGAAFMADVYGRLSGKAGVCLSTLGPGATNLMTGVADATLDHAPLVAISGQVSTERKYAQSHQYIDLQALFKPITKWNGVVTTPATIPEVVRKAFKIAETGKPGAIHLEVPEDVAAERLRESDVFLPLRIQSPRVPEPSSIQVKRAIAVLSGAKRPLILAGNGVVRKRADEAVRRFARRMNTPVVHTFMGKGIVPDSDLLSLYTIGFPGRDYAARVVEQADVVVAVGTLSNTRPACGIPTETNASYTSMFLRRTSMHTTSSTWVCSAMWGRHSTGWRTGWLRSSRSGPNEDARPLPPVCAANTPAHPAGRCVRSRSSKNSVALLLRTIWWCAMSEPISFGWRACFLVRLPIPASFRTALLRWGSRCRGRWQPNFSFLRAESLL
jgi:hypothetical protein